MNIMGITRRIQKICETVKVTEEQMLSCCGLSDKVIKNMEKGSYPSVYTIAIIAKYFKLSIEQLLNEQPNDDEIFSRLSHCLINYEIETMKPIQETLSEYLTQKEYFVDISEEFKYKYINLSKESRKTIDEILDFTYNKEQLDDTATTNLKVYKIAAGAGVSIPFSDDDSFIIKKFPQTDVPTNATCGIYINGDSMEPKYPDGSLLWIKETQDVNYGDIVIAILNGEPFCKIYQETGLYSINKKFSPIFVNENDSFTVFGKVLGYYVN